LETQITFHATPNPAGEYGNTRTTRTLKFIFDSNGIPKFGQIEVLGEPLSAPKGEPNLLIGIIENRMYRTKEYNKVGRNWRKCLY
tara:strand:+ start:68 stop:322 length:255 start_codon:yes stop_codon:yes gene_type:complete